MQPLFDPGTPALPSSGREVAWIIIARSTSSKWPSRMSSGLPPRNSSFPARAWLTRHSMSPYSSTRRAVLTSLKPSPGWRGICSPTPMISSRRRSTASHTRRFNSSFVMGVLSSSRPRKPSDIPLPRAPRGRLTANEPVGQENPHIHARLARGDPARHEPGGDRREQDTAPEVRGRNPEPFDAGPRPEHREAVGRPRAESVPRAADREVAERGYQLERRAEKPGDRLGRDGALEADALDRRSDEELARGARGQIDVLRVHTEMQDGRHMGERKHLAAPRLDGQPRAE